MRSFAHHFVPETANSFTSLSRTFWLVQSCLASTLWFSFNQSTVRLKRFRNLSRDSMSSGALSRSLSPSCGCVQKHYIHQIDHHCLFMLIKYCTSAKTDGVATLRHRNRTPLGPKVTTGIPPRSLSEGTPAPRLNIVKRHYENRSSNCP